MHQIHCLCECVQTADRAWFKSESVLWQLHFSCLGRLWNVPCVDSVGTKELKSPPFRLLELQSVSVFYLCAASDYVGGFNCHLVSWIFVPIRELSNYWTFIKQSVRPASHSQNCFCLSRLNFWMICFSCSLPHYGGLLLIQDYSFAVVGYNRQYKKERSIHPY